VIGQVDKTIYCDDWDTHVLTIGRTRSGKGVFHLIPTLRWFWRNGSALIGDPKNGENYHATHAARRQYGRVEAFAPYARPPCCINVEDTIRWGDPREFDDALTIGQSLTAPRTMAKESEVSLHFRELAAMLLAAVQLHVGYTSAERSLPGVWRFLTQRPGKTKGRKLLETLELMGKTAHVDHRGDQYALAVITFEMLAGRTPFAGDDVMDVLRQVISSEPPAIEQLAPHVPPDAGDVLRRALSKDPEQRFPSITEFANALLRASGTSLPPPVDSLGLAMTVPAGPPPGSASKPVAPQKPSDRYQTGMRAKTPADVTAPTLANAFSPNDLSRALDQARQAHGMGDIELAVTTAWRFALRDSAPAMTEAHLAAAIDDLIPTTRDQRTIDRMTLIALDECRNKRLLPRNAEAIRQEIKARGGTRS